MKTANPRRPSFVLLLPLALLALAGPASADELRLHDGRVLVGKVAEKGERLEVTTRDGIVALAKKDVSSWRKDGELRQALAAQAKPAGDSTFAHLNLAMQARAFGLDAELWQHLDRALARLPEAPADVAPALQRHLADFLAQLGPELLPLRQRGAPTKVRVHQLLEHLREGGSPGRAAAVEELLVREPAADEDLRREVRSNPSPQRRIGALAALQQRTLAGNDRFVLRTAVLDGSPAVRAAAAGLSRPTLRADDVAYLASGLTHQNAKVRVRTAEALGELGHADAIKMLVLAAPHAAKGLAAPDGGNAGTRGHVAFLQQQAYIRDFDVEVAAGSFIADPKVDVLQSGTVLDVTVFGVVIEEVTIVQAYRQALQKLAKQDPGPDARGWPNWLANLQRQQEATAPTTPKAPPR